MEGQKNKWVAKLTVLVSFEQHLSHVLFLYLPCVVHI